MNWRKVRIRDVINPKKWWIVLDAYIKKSRGVTLERCERAALFRFTQGEVFADFWARKVMGQNLEYAEVVVERASLCKDCVDAGSCKHCGCSCPDNMFSMKNECSGGNWGPVVLNKQ